MLRKWKKDTRCIFFSFMSVNLSFDFELLYLSIKFSVTNCCWDKWGSWWWSAIGCKLWQFVLVGRKRTLSSLKIHNPYFSVVPDFIWRINLMDIGEETVWSDYLCFLQNNIKWFFFFFSTVKPTVIDVDIYVNSIGPVSSINMVSDLLTKIFIWTIGLGINTSFWKR